MSGVIDVLDAIRKLMADPEFARLFRYAEGNDISEGNDGSTSTKLSIITSTTSSY